MLLVVLQSLTAVTAYRARQVLVERNWMRVHTESDNTSARVRWHHGWYIAISPVIGLLVVWAVIDSNP